MKKAFCCLDHIPKWKSRGCWGEICCLIKLVLKTPFITIKFHDDPETMLCVKTQITEDFLCCFDRYYSKNFIISCYFMFILAVNKRVRWWMNYLCKCQKSVFRTISNIHGGVFLRNKIDLWQGPNFAFVLISFVEKHTFLTKFNNLNKRRKRTFLITNL